MEPNLVQDVSKEFKREGLADFVHESIDAESYGTEPLRRVTDEFIHQLGEKTLSLGETLSGHGVEFFWAVNMGKAGISPVGIGSGHKHTSPDGTEHIGLESILAFIRDSIDIDEITDSYWEERHLEVRRPPILNMDSLGL